MTLTADSLSRGGGKLRGLQLIDSSGNVFDFPMITEEDERMPFSGIGCGVAFAFKVEGNYIKVAPVPTAAPGCSIRFLIYFRPNELCAATDAAQITAINTGTGQVTVGAVPSTFSTVTSLDLINGYPGFECRAYDWLPQRTGALITFASASGLAIGDWIALSGQSPIP